MLEKAKLWFAFLMLLLWVGLAVLSIMEIHGSGVLPSLAWFTLLFSLVGLVHQLFSMLHLASKAR